MDEANDGVPDLADGVPGLAATLNHLFATVLMPGGQGLWTNEAAARTLSEHGTLVTGAYLGMLRGGKRTNPSARNLHAIATLFGVPLDYFFTGPVRTQTDDDLRLLMAVKAHGVEGLGRSLGLTGAGVALVVDFADQLRRYEATLRSQQ